MDYSYVTLNSENLKIYPMQMLALEKFKNINNKYICIFDEVGVGKTIEAGMIIWEIIRNIEKPNILIVCPKTLTYNWYTELFMHFGFEFKIVEGTKESIFYCDTRISNLLITAIDSGENEGLCKIKSKLDQDNNNLKWDLMIIDEGHEALSDLRSGVLKNFKSEKAIFMTATPIKNSIDELNEELCILNAITGDNFQLPRNEDLLEFNLKSRFVRNFKETVKYINKIKKSGIQTAECKVKGRFIDIIPYNIIKNRDEIKAHINKKQSLDLYHDICNIAYFSQKGKELKEIQKNDDKLQKCIKVLEEMQKTSGENSKKNRAIIFCKRKETVYYLKSALNEKFKDKVLAITSKTHQIGERKQILNILGNKKTVSEYDDIKILIIIDSLAEVGLNLPTFNYAISYELPFTPAKLEQCFGRIDRLTSQFAELKFIIFQEDDDEIYLERRILNILYGKLFNEVLEFIPSRNILYSTASPELEYGYYAYLKLNDKFEESEIVKKEFDSNNNFDFKFEMLKEGIDVDEQQDKGVKAKIKSGFEKKFEMFLNVNLKNSKLEDVIKIIKDKATGIDEILKKLKTSVLYKKLIIDSNDPKKVSTKIQITEITKIIDDIYNNQSYKNFDSRIREVYIENILEIENKIKSLTIEQIFSLRGEIEKSSKNYFIIYSIYYGIWKMIKDNNSISFSEFLIGMTQNKETK